MSVYVVEIFYTWAGWSPDWDTVTTDYELVKNLYRHAYRTNPDNRVRIAKFTRTVAGVPKRAVHVK